MEGVVNLIQARKAQEDLALKIGRPLWLRGIGISLQDYKGFLLKVNVQEITDEVLKTVPTSVNGVPVCIEAVGTISAFREE